MPRFEDPHTQTLVDAVASKIKEFRRPPTLYVLGGGPQWRFAKIAATNTNIEKIFYGDNDAKEKEMAEKAGLWTVQVDPSNAEEIASGSRYDILLMKNTFEEVAGRITNMDEYLIAIYKTIKLKGFAVMITRLRPTVPLPEKAKTAWHAAVPDKAGFEKAIEDTGIGLDVNYEVLKLKCTCTKKEYKEMLKKNELPFCKNLTDKELDTAFTAFKTEQMSFTDEVYVITIKKKILRLTRDELGLIVDEGLEMGDNAPAAVAAAT